MSAATIARLSGLLPLFLTLTLSFASDITVRAASFTSAGKKIHIEEYCPQVMQPPAATVIFLHGSGGLESKSFRYREMAGALAGLGYCVYLPHYLDATRGATANAEHHYPVWVQVVEDAAAYIVRQAGAPPGRIALIGYSLGASIALATSAAHPQFSAVVAFSGGLPDDYFRIVKTLPPLLIIHGREDQVIPVRDATQLAALCELRKLVCDVQLYPGEGHAFSAAALSDAGRRMEDFLKHHAPAHE